MKRISLYLAAALFCASFLPGALSAQRVPTVAIAPFVIDSVIDRNDAEIIADSFFNRLMGRHRVRVLERGALDRVIDEHRFQASDWSDPEKTAARGRALNADWIVLGNIRKFSNGRLYVMVRFFHVNTREVRGAPEGTYANLDEAFNGLERMIDRLLAQLTAGGVLEKPKEPPKQRVPYAFKNHARFYFGMSMDTVSKVYSGGEDYNLNFGFTLDASYLFLNFDYTRIGVGASYWLPRHAYGGDGSSRYDILSRSFSDLAGYATVQLHPAGAGKYSGFYVKGNLGYNWPVFSTLDEGETIDGGFYFGVGVGIEIGDKTRWVLEFLYNDYAWTHSYAGKDLSAGYRSFTIATGIRF